MNTLRSALFLTFTAIASFTGSQAFAQGFGAAGGAFAGANTCVGRVNGVYRNFPEFAPFSCSTRTAPNKSCTCTFKSEFDGSTVIGTGTSQGPKAEAAPTPIKVSPPLPPKGPPKCRTVNGRPVCY